MSELELTAGLNEAQTAAVTAGMGPLLILAGPGSGKTRVLTHRIAYLIQEHGLPPWRILAVTFTNKAAKEMRHRIAALLGDHPRGLTMGTFHATCAGILRREADRLPYHTDAFVIFDTDDQKQVMKQTLRDLNLDDKRYPPAKMLSYISAAKNEGIFPADYVATTHISELARRCYVQYQQLLQTNNAVDFDDLLMLTVQLFDQNPDLLAQYHDRYHYILVDEFQDTNTVQYALLRRLAAGNGNILAVGDSDQSIYKWRGADFRNIRRFQEHFPEAQTILLEQNYRSTQLILDAAMAVIQHNPERVHKQLRTERTDGEAIVVKEAYDEREEAGMVIDLIAAATLEGYDPGDVAVMYRTNAQSRALEEAFLQRGLPYKLVGATRFYNRREIKDIIAYLRVTHNPLDSVSFNRAINTPTRGIGKKSQLDLTGWGAEHGWQPGEAIIQLATNLELQHPFRARAANAMNRFGEMLINWVALKEKVGVGALLDRILDDINFRDYIVDGTPEGEDRWENVMELRGVAAMDDSVTLPQFLEQVALVSEVDNLEEETNAPTLLTLHAAKGLEFPVVIITGLEDGILPHSRSFDDMDNMAEERRLFYVGITRAKDRLYFLRAFRRASWGNYDNSAPSRFLDELPADAVDGVIPQQRRSTKSWEWDASPLQRLAGSRGSQAAYPSVRSTRKRATPITKKGSIPSTTQAPKNSSLKPQKNGSQFKAGQRVSHPKFGDGIVVSSKLRGQDEEVTVAFADKDAGIKTLVASIAKLERRD